MGRPSFCLTCVRPWPAGSLAERCPHCGADASRPGSDLSNTLAEPGERIESSGSREMRRAPSDLSNSLERPHAPPRILAERDCPRCAEKIKARARVCRFCAFDFEAEDKKRQEDSEPLGRKLRRQGSPNSARLAALQSDRREGAFTVAVVIVSFALGLFVVALLFSSHRESRTWVHAYVKKDGTFVSGHWR